LNVKHLLVELQELFLRTAKHASHITSSLIVNSIASKHLNHAACVQDLACNGNSASNLSPHSHLYPGPGFCLKLYGTTRVTMVYMLYM